MKKTFTLFIGIVLSVAILKAQEEAPPQAFSYKAVISGSNGLPLANEDISLRISILQNSLSKIIVYSETFQPTTNVFGQIDIQIGKGTPESGIFSDIKWGSDEYFLRTEVDIEGGTAYQQLSETQLLSVPYSLYAGEAKNGFATEYTNGEIRPILHEGGIIALGPDWHEYFKLNVTGPAVLRPTDNTYSSQLWLDAMKSGGNQHVITSEGSYSWVPGGLIIKQNSENWDDFTKSIVMNNKGNVGIGLSNPWSKLDVNGGLRLRAGSLTYGPGVTLDATSIEGGKWYVIASLGGDAQEGQGHFLIRDDDWSAVILMDPDGKVGIGLGKGNPAYKLDVAGDINFTGKLFNNGIPFSSGSTTWEEIIDKPTFAKVATSGSYTDLSNKPVTDGSETIISAGTNIIVTGNGTSSKPYLVSTDAHEVGERYGGGIVFYVYDNGQHGLIAATEDLTYIQWYNGANKYTGSTGDGLGAGAMNTAMIVAAQMTDDQKGNFASKICADWFVRVGDITYGDWYLPSKYELNLLYDKRDVVGGFNTGRGYWSSTERDNKQAWLQEFYAGGQYSDVKRGLCFVRAIRSF